MIARPMHFQAGGLNTRAEATGLPLLECSHLQEMRVVGTDWVERDGIVRVGSFSGNATALDFDGTDQFCYNTVDPRVWALGLYWTIELAIELDTAAGTQGILTVGTTVAAMDLMVTGGNLRFRVWDTDDVLDTITVGAAATSTQTIQITRSGATLSAKLNNGTAVTATMSTTLSVRTPTGSLFVSRNGTDYMNGTLDYLRVFSTVKADHADRLIRHPFSRAENVLADYDFFKAPGGMIYDKSRYENHLIYEVQNAPAAVTSLCHNPAPIRALAMGRDENNRKQLLVCAGGKHYLCAVD